MSHTLVSAQPGMISMSDQRNEKHGQFSPGSLVANVHNDLTTIRSSQCDPRSSS